MPLKPHVGLSKKNGQANFGSRGASLSLEVELDAGAIEQPRRMRGCIQKLFGLARDALDEELHGRGGRRASSPGAGAAPAAGASGRNGEREEGAGVGPHDDLAAGGPLVRPATEGQVRAIRGIAQRRGVDLGALLREGFDVERPEDLSVRGASSLIDQLKHQNGKQPT